MTTHEETHVCPFEVDRAESQLIAEFTSLRRRIFTMDTATGVDFSRAAAAGWKRYAWFGLAEACRVLLQDIDALTGRPCWWIGRREVEAIRLCASLLVLRLTAAALGSLTPRRGNS